MIDGKVKGKKLKKNKIKREKKAIFRKFYPKNKGIGCMFACFFRLKISLITGMIHFFLEKNFKTARLPLKPLKLLILPLFKKSLNVLGYRVGGSYLFLGG